MTNQLELSEPAFKTYPKHANISAMMGNSINYKNWLYTNHIQLFCASYTDKNSVQTYLDTYEPLHRLHYPYIEKKSVNKDFFASLKIGAIDFVRYCIDRGY
ncbi:hypothetical protein [Paenibacillus silvisoli]|uniref:hypothetical protein n=1 Tax=Paenibacillus silvisoli TaxID=3110539 RepID=UPI0028053CB5|nr:hypothetical protein [Paenibacillus silvisoli]